MCHVVLKRVVVVAQDTKTKKVLSIALVLGPESLTTSNPYSITFFSLFSFWESKTQPIPHQPQVNGRLNEALRHLSAEHNVSREHRADFEQRRAISRPL